ncbi:MAG TPA: helix-turn-helix domain-containing protein [Nitrospirales bacterium]|jgi:two-component system nitrogen regulation response regulator GlnG
MPLRNVINVLLLTADPDLAELYRHECPDCVVTIAKDAAALSRKADKHRFDVLIMESRKDWVNEDWVNEVKAVVDTLGPPPVMTLVGSAAFLRRSSESVRALSNGHAVPRGTTELPQELGFDAYVAVKLRDFVRRMKLGDGSDLHSLLVKTVEKPLILLVLEETRGNQIQAAALLGLNRNTLRKKIKDLKISVTKLG